MTVYKLRAFRDELWSRRVTYEVEAESFEQAVQKIQEESETYETYSEDADFTETIRFFPEDAEDFEVLEGE